MVPPRESAIALVSTSLMHVKPRETADGHHSALCQSSRRGCTPALRSDTAAGSAAALSTVSTSCMPTARGSEEGRRRSPRRP